MGVGGPEAGHARTEICNAQVGIGPHVEAGDDGIETGNAQVGVGSSAGSGAMTGLGASVWDDGGGGIGDQGQEGG